MEDQGRQRHQQQRRERQPLQEQEPTQQIRGVINTIACRFSNEGQSNQSQKRHLHGVLIANEVVEEVWRSKRPCLVFKVDFEKA